MVQSILLSFKNISTKGQYRLTHTAFEENFIDKIMQFNPYSRFGKS